MLIVSNLMSVPLHQWMTMSLCFCRKDHEKAEFEVHEVYAVDVLISTGEGKVRGIFGIDDFFILNQV